MDREDKVILIILIVVLAGLVAFVSFAVYMAVQCAQVEKECLSLGYESSRLFTDGRAYCIRQETGTTVVVPLERARLGR